MKVLYFLTHVTNSGGMEHIVIDKINYLANHGYYVSLAYFGTYDDDSFFPIDEKVKRIPIIQKKRYKILSWQVSLGIWTCYQTKRNYTYSKSRCYSKCKCKHY